MDAQARRHQSVVAAACVVVLTAGVFLASQYGGPASTVTRYLKALDTGDRALQQAVSLYDVRSYESQMVENYVRTLLSYRLRPHLGQTQKQGTEAMVMVEFGDDPRQYWFCPLVLRKSEGSWLVDTKATFKAISRDQGQ